MWTVLYGIIITILVVCAGTAWAAHDLDGKALFCKSVSEISDHPFYGLVFNKGSVTRFHVDGYSKVALYKNRNYHLKGTEEVFWHNNELYRQFLNRETLKTGNDQCEISTENEIFQKLDVIISAAKKKNKI